MTIGRPLGAKLFLEGMEVPFMGATITFTVGQASIAYIDCVPEKSLNNIKPRTHVKLAVRDYNDARNEFPYVDAWEGEVFGFSFGKTASSRSFTLQCIDPTSYWDNALSYYINPVFTLGQGGMNMMGVGLDAVTTEQFGFKTIASGDTLSSLLFTTIENETKNKDFLEGFVKVYKTISDINEFYQIAEERIRIFDRVILQSSGKLNELLEVEQALRWFQGVVGKTAGGGFSSLRMVVQELLSVIFHDYCTVPFPARIENEDIASPAVTSPDAQDKRYTIGNFIFKPNLYMVPPPACNIFFPDEYSNFQYSRHFFKEPTRLIYKPQMPTLLSGEGVSLEYKFQPDSLEGFMLKKDAWAKYKGTGDFDVSGTDPGKYMDDDNNETTSKTNNKKVREGQFLTNEEKMKGIWMAQESLMPAVTIFKSGITPEERIKFMRNISRYLFFKKRFEPRSLQITSHLKLSVVPGFNVLLLDDSDSAQSTLAYCSSVTHRIYATEGGYTNVQLSYARTADEEATASNKGNDPVIPPWFDENVFGQIVKPPTSEAAGDAVADKGTAYVNPSNDALSTYYKNLLGAKGFQAITGRYAKEPTILGATQQLLSEYRERRRQGPEVLQAFIASITGRDYIRIRDSFAFLGAKLQEDTQNTAVSSTSQKKTTNLTFSQFNVFKGGAFDTTNPKFGKTQLLKMNVITAYRNMLIRQRGFRG